MTLVVAANSQDDVPGNRRGIELESSRTFSSAKVRDLQSPDSVRGARAARALAAIKDKRALARRALAIDAAGLLCDAPRVDARANAGDLDANDSFTVLDALESCFALGRLIEIGRMSRAERRRQAKS